MANRWPGSLIRKTPVTPTGPSQTGTAPGRWTLAEAAYWTKQNLWPIAGVVADPDWSSVSYLMSTTTTNGGQNNTFIDSSTNNFTVTRVGNPTQGSLSPYKTPPVSYPGYSASSYGGSGYFDGSGDCLTVPANAVFNFGTGDFTAEFWMYKTGSAAYQRLLAYGGFGAAGNFQVEFTDDVTATIHINGAYITTTVPNVLNKWVHVAVTRQSGSVRVFTDGVLRSTNSQTGNVSQTNPFSIGAVYDASSPYTGFIANVRVVKGTAVYTATFTPPTAPVTEISGTSLLCNFVNANSFDAAMRCDLETAGNAQVSTAQAKFGTTSMSFDGSGDYLRVNTYDPNLFAFGTGNFTIEFWLRINTTAGLQFMYEGRGASTTPTIYMNGATLTYYTNGINAITGATLSTGVWYHVALARSGTSTKMFLDGTQTGSTYTDSTNYTNIAGRPVFGIESGLSLHSLNGYLDDLRVTKGVARYTSNFTAPTAAFPGY